MMQSTLVLNASYEPLSVVSARRAVRLVTRGRAVPLDLSPHTLRAENMTFAVPYVVLMKEQIKQSSRARAPRYSKHGVLVRDAYTCQYCFKHGNTIDHVVPVSLGGESTYENCVTACSACNGKKSNKTLEQIGWRLPSAPRVPTLYENMLNRARNDMDTHSIWKQYISYYEPRLALQK